MSKMYFKNMFDYQAVPRRAGPDIVCSLRPPSHTGGLLLRGMEGKKEGEVGWLVESLTSQLTHYRSYRKRSSRSITWQVLAKLNQTTTKYS